MLQLDNVSRLSRRRLCTSVLHRWTHEAARGKQIAREARLTKVFKCWHLFKNEQVLLRRYLHECSTASFRSGVGRGVTPPGSVNLHDFEHLYTQMAAYRWDAIDLISD